jgi:UPF0271 protein
MAQIDLNADLGESFGPWVMGADAQMMKIVTSANIACGGHAGDPATMFKTLKLAVDNGVTIGAHPGYDDKEGFGRRRIPLSADEVVQLIAAQIGTLRGVAALVGAEVKYVKPHGMLNNFACVDMETAKAIAGAVKAAHPDLAMLAISGTMLEVASKEAGLVTYSEIFADRGYTDGGTLVPRSEPGAMIEDPVFAADRLVAFSETGMMPTVSGGSIPLEAHSICVHGDSDHAVAMAGQVKAALVAKGIDVGSFLRGAP